MRLSLWLLLMIFNSSCLIAQKLSSIQKGFLDKYGKEIRTEKKTGELIWEPVAESVSGKTIVALGEVNHGSREIFLYRNELIKYLHEQLGYDVVLFESGLGEMATVNQFLPQYQGDQLTSGFFGGWQTSEFRELMDYLKEEKMGVGGFDVQRTGAGFVGFYEQQARLNGWSAKDIASEERAFGEIKSRLSDYGSEFSDLEEETLALIKKYRELIGSLPSTGQEPKTDLLLAKRTFENRIGYLSYMLRFKENDDWNARWKARDSLMASNVIWYRDNVFKGKKVILVAHNFHISKENPREEVMGEFLDEKYGNYYYSMGIFTGEGKYIDSRGNERTTEPPSMEGLDIKHLIQELNQPLTFIDCADKKYRGGEWLDEEIIINDSFIDLHNSKTLVLSKVFDGLLLIDKSNLPEK